MLEMTFLTLSILLKGMDELLQNHSLKTLRNVPSFKIENLVVLAKPYDHKLL